MSDAVEPVLARAALVGVLIQLANCKLGARLDTVNAIVNALNDWSSFDAQVSAANPAASIAAYLQGKIDLQAHEAAAIEAVRACNRRSPIPSAF